MLTTPTRRLTKWPFIMPPRNILLLSMFLVVGSVCAADNVKVKVIDRCDHIDPRTSTLSDVRAKTVATNDPEHRKVLELFIDYAKPGTWPGYVKSFPAGMLNPKKYSALRFWYRSDSATGFVAQFIRDTPRKDGNVLWFGSALITGKNEWTQVTISLADFKRGGAKVWKNGAHVVFPGGDPIDDDDYENIVKVRFTTLIDWRGTGTAGHLMFDAIELVEK